MKTFFVSYNRADRHWAEWIAWQLDAANYSTVIQAWDFGAGSNFALEMHKAALDTEHTIAVLSPDFLRSEFCAPEWTAAFARDAGATRRKLLPVIVRECESLGLLAAYSHISLIGKDEAQARQELLSAIADAIAIAKGGRAKPAAPPGFPGAALSRRIDVPVFPGGQPAAVLHTPVGPRSTRHVAHPPESPHILAAGIESAPVAKRVRKGKIHISVCDIYGQPLRENVDIVIESRTGPEKVSVRGVPGSKQIVVSDLSSGPGSIYHVTVDAPSCFPVSKDVSLATIKAVVTFMCPINPMRVASVLFPLFNNLPTEVRRLMQDSDRLLGFDGLAGQQLYAALDDPRRAHLLNVSVKAGASVLPNRRTVLSYLHSILELRADRYFALTSRELREELKNAVVATREFRVVEGALHHPRLPPGYEDFSHGGNFKSSDMYGSIQLTFYLNNTHTVTEISLDDGDGLRLLFGIDSDLAGGRPSHPFELQQILKVHQHLDPGYVLRTAG